MISVVLPAGLKLDRVHLNATSAGCARGRPIKDGGGQDKPSYSNCLQYLLWPHRGLLLAYCQLNPDDTYEYSTHVEEGKVTTVRLL